MLLLFMLDAADAAPSWLPLLLMRCLLIVYTLLA